MRIGYGMIAYTIQYYSSEQEKFGFFSIATGAILYFQHAIHTGFNLGNSSLCGASSRSDQSPSGG